MDEDETESDLALAEKRQDPVIGTLRPQRKCAAIETTGLSKSFGDTLALDNLDLRIEQGMVFGFLGPNGAGKTTMIRLLLDLIRPTGGTARVLGFDVNADSLEVRRRCGYLPGELKLPARSSAGQVLRHLARLRGDVDWKKATDIADRLGLDMNRRTDEMSKGNRQKVGLVAAFMADPELVILDEPTSGLDPLRQQDVRELMRETAAAGRTVLLSSHDLDQVEHVAERVGIIREGALVAHEEVAALRSRAVREVTVQYEGDQPNLSGFDGVEIVEHGDDYVRLRVTGHMDRLVKALAQANVVSISSSKPELDEIFLSYYEARS
jgi:ABC-2 type transport system ATP-binding protein